jgi:uncharacterized protein YndB with AHSA1/START domain
VNEFVVELSRTFAVPRTKVYRAWLEPETLQRWLFPPDQSIRHAEVDERVGGRHYVEMVGPQGEHHAFDSTITELVPEERIVLQFTFVGPDPRTMREETLMTLTFADGPAPGTTDFTLRQERIEFRIGLTPDNVNAGWEQALAKLAAAIERSQ